MTYFVLEIALNLIQCSGLNLKINGAWSDFTDRFLIETPLNVGYKFPKDLLCHLIEYESAFVEIYSEIFFLYPYRLFFFSSSSKN